MCGFCGYVNYKKDVANKDNIEFMNNIIKHRGPNEQNVIIKDNIALGHVRLSIIDLKLGSQPMEKEHGGNKYVICYNGELYNTKEIKDDLIKKGYSFEYPLNFEKIRLNYSAGSSTLASVLIEALSEPTLLSLNF